MLYPLLKGYLKLQLLKNAAALSKKHILSLMSATLVANLLLGPFQDCDFDS